MSGYKIGVAADDLDDARDVFGVDPASRYTPGRRVVALDGIARPVGYPRSTWLFALIDVEDWATIKTTYLGGELSAEAYVETRDDEDTWAIWRALVTLPEPSTLTRWAGYYQNVAVELVLLEDVTPV